MGNIWFLIHFNTRDEQRHRLDASETREERCKGRNKCAGGLWVQEEEMGELMRVEERGKIRAEVFCGKSGVA